MSKTTWKHAAWSAAALALLLAPADARAQAREAEARRAPAIVAPPGEGATPGAATTPRGAAPAPEQRGPLGEPAPPAVLGAADSLLVTVDSTAADDAPLGTPASADDAPLGETVPTPPRRSFLPRARVLEGVAPVSAVGSGRGLAGTAFLEDQLTHQRVIDAQLDAKFDLKALFAERGLAYPPRDLYFRLFKQEQLLEVWVRDAPNAETYTLLRDYPICAIPGRLGPKTRLDDFQAPEGFYYIEGFNPESDFHLSLRLNYPNAADRIIGVEDHWGGDIYIHGGCSTVGCFPMTDSAMAELYWLAVEARTAGQTTIPVHVFPARMTDESMRWLGRTFERDERLLAFWENLREGYAYFEENRQLPVISVDGRGRYLFTSPTQPSVPEVPREDGPLGAERATIPTMDSSPATTDSSPATTDSSPATTDSSPRP